MENMYYDLLQKPLKGFNPLKPEDTFTPIAIDLMKNYHIKCGNVKLFFAEIEFYYSRVEDKECLEKAHNQWEGVTYTRKTNAGDFFYHLSGCDICFESNLENSIGEEGGILIRSVVDESGKITAGPMTCVNMMLNACGKGYTPTLCKNNKIREAEIVSTYRFLGDKDFKSIKDNNNKDGNLKLAFFDNKLNKKDWDNARPSYYSSRIIKYNK